jgi:dinuclear metal center YbgI/SA1388 family protein
MAAIKDIINFLETVAPPAWQEGYDNSGLACGNAEDSCSGIMASLDLTQDVVDEAAMKGANLIIVHHPPIFKGLKSLAAGNDTADLMVHCIRKNMAVYAIHTNLDNVLEGVNGEIGRRLGLENLKVLVPMANTHRKLVTYAPASHAEQVRAALFAVGAGSIGLYDECSFNLSGAGTFRPKEGSNPFSGKLGVRQHDQEERIETIYPIHSERKIISALLSVHPYETVAYDMNPLENRFESIGSGAIGKLNTPMDESEFLALVKETFQTGVIRHTPTTGRMIQHVAICGGSGKSLINNALIKKADVFLTADLGYHDFFIPQGKMLLADMGHFESEQFTSDLIIRLINEKFPTFAVLKSGVNTNPVNYFT